MDGAERGQGLADEVECLIPAFRVGGEGALQFAGTAGRRAGVGPKDRHGLLELAALGPAVEMLEALPAGLGGVEEAPEQCLGGVGDSGVQSGVRPDGCEEGDGPGRGRRHVLAPGGRGPAEAVRGVAEVGRVVEVDRAELAAGVLGLGPQRGGGGDDEGGALRGLEGASGQFETGFPGAEQDLRGRLGETAACAVSTRTSERGSGLFRSWRGEHRFEGGARRGSRERSDIRVLLRLLGLGLVGGGA